MAQEREAFVGEWSVEAVFPGVPPSDDRGTVSFEWLRGREFLIERWQVPDPGPDGIAVIGSEPDGDGYLQHYFDARGVARVYRMSLSGGTWKLWRDEADFSPLPFRQRFTGTFSDDGNKIEGAWERTEEDGSWVLDFDLIYTRAAS